jgi:hypothetical protein
MMKKVANFSRDDSVEPEPPEKIGLGFLSISKYPGLRRYQLSQRLTTGLGAFSRAKGVIVRQSGKSWLPPLIYAEYAAERDEVRVELEKTAAADRAT